MANRFLWFLLIIAFAMGGAITWIDTRPGWDDTGVTAVLVFIATAIFGFISPPRAWLFALAIAAWIPAIGLPQGNYATILALLVGFGGAYAGATARRLIASMAR
jgi:hypothetical protein